MPSPTKSPAKKAPEGDKVTYDLEAQAAVTAAPTGPRHKNCLTWDDQYDASYPQNVLDEEVEPAMGGMPVAFKVRPELGRCPC